MANLNTFDDKDFSPVLKMVYQQFNNRDVILNLSDIENKDIIDHLCANYNVSFFKFVNACYALSDKW